MRELLTPVQIQSSIAGELELASLIVSAVKDVDLVIIDSDAKLPIANSRLGTINELLKHIEKMRKELKAPILKEGKEIEAYASTIKTPLEKAKGIIGSKILAFKKAKEAVQLVEQEEKAKIRQQKETTEINEVALIKRIREQVNARLFGGNYMTGSNMVVPCEPALTITQVQGIHDKLVNEFPIDAFTYLTKEAVKTQKEMQNLCLNHMKKLNSIKDQPEAEKISAIQLDKHQAEVATTVATATTEDALERDSKINEKRETRGVKAATKGIRKSIQFGINNIEDVPRQYLMIDEVKINQFIRDNKITILNGINKNKEGSAIPGIRFWEDSTYVAT